MNVLLSGWVVAAGLVLAGASTPASALPIDPSLSVAGQTAAGLTPVQWMCDDLGNCRGPARPSPGLGAPQRAPGLGAPQPRSGWGPPQHNRGWGPPHHRPGWGPRRDRRWDWEPRRRHWERW